MARAQALIVACVVIAACSKADSAPETASAQTQPSQKNVVAKNTRLPDLCTLVTKEEAESILGMKLEPPQRQSGGDCWYLREGGKDFGDVEFILSVPPVWVKSEKEFDELVASQTKEMNTNLKATGIAAEPYKAERAEGVGAPAYFIDPGLYVMKGTRVLAVALGGSKGVAIAKIAVSRM